ncbi:MAG: PDZ domain-containing protein [Pyrinomonadaceae bacterium]
MQSEAGYESGGEPHANAVTTTCLNCRAAMPREMRFCRACGQRLGEGLAEYVETIRFDQSPRAADYVGQRARAAASDVSPQRETATDYGVKNFGARVADDVVHGTFKGVEELFKNLEKHFKQNHVKISAQTSRLPSFGCGVNAVRFNRQKNETGVRTKKRGAHWLTWMSFWIVIGLFFTVFINLTSSDSRRRTPESRVAASRAREATIAVRQKIAALREAALNVREEIIADTTNGTRSMIGVSGLKSITTGDNDKGGAFIESVSVPGSPADKAGLVGGDIVTSFDNQFVKSAGDMRKLLAATPAGKSVDVIFLRDGEAKHTTLVTAAKDQVEQLTDTWEKAADKQGTLGLDDSDFARVAVPGTSIYGVQLGEVARNSAAGLSGLREKDLLIEFDGAPIRTVEEFAARIKRAAPGKTIKAVVMRGAERLEIPVVMGQDD